MIDKRNEENIKRTREAQIKLAYDRAARELPEWWETLTEEQRLEYARKQFPEFF